MNINKHINYSDKMHRLYKTYELPIADSRSFSRNITLQVCDKCNLNCKYCYEIHKQDNIMDFFIAKKVIDNIFDLYEDGTGDFVNKNTKVIILDFIGGEPFLAIDLISQVTEYFFTKVILLDHIWADTFRISIATNGVNYFDERVQKYLKKFNDKISLTVTVDGHKELHDSCRVFPDGSGSFDYAYAAMNHYRKTYSNNTSTKITIAPENIKEIGKAINFFIDEGFDTIYANTIYEADWTVEQAKIYYAELIKIADYLISQDKDIFVSLFDGRLFCPIPETENNNYCGGTGAMVAYDYKGIAYPCLRYMESSLGDSQVPIVVGTLHDGLHKLPEHKYIQDKLNEITRRSQSTDECFFCPIASGCSWCSAWNYQKFGTVNKRDTTSCIMHKARSLAAVYYFNKLNDKNAIKDRFAMHITHEWALEIISEVEKLKNILVVVLVKLNSDLFMTKH